MSRNTVQQEIICSAVKNMTNHPSPDEVFKAVRSSYPSIGRATVYRVLNKLAEKGEIRKVNIPNTADRFDFRTDEHIHIRCTECDSVFDAEFDGSAELLRQVHMVMDSGCGAVMDGFEATGVNLCFDGICKDCRNKKEKQQ